MKENKGSKEASKKESSTERRQVIEARKKERKKENKGSKPEKCPKERIGSCSN